MDNDKFNVLIDNFYKSNEQLEKALSIMSEYSQKQKKADAVSAELIAALSKGNAAELIGVSEAMKNFVENSYKQLSSIEKTLKTLSADVNEIKKKVEDIDVSAGLIMRNTEVGFAKLENRISKLEETPKDVSEE